ncbi:hypothetical protein [Clostridium sporogenes]|uniref:hypothetical protein n=1 Tax=Clostridium sporogenes TaxID=1509 RepID=UPI0013D8214C|nr:hypothetical protein [Clostridium sporogenes]NFF75887.1 hypothetical protein [Clostridium sporogenes]NFH40774.1 hypothetical protein [Clostridium sporogenes]
MIQKELDIQESLNLIDNKFNDFKKFVENKKPTYCELREDSNEIIFDEIDYYGRQYMIIIPYKIKSKNPKIIFRDDLTDIQKLHWQYNIDIDVIKPLYNKLILDIEKLGCKLYNSCCGGNETYEWYDLSMDLSDFNEEKLKKCTELWTSYNEELSKYKNNYNLKT